IQTCVRSRTPTTGPRLLSTDGEPQYCSRLQGGMKPSMEQQGREGSASGHKASEEVYRLWNLAQQLEAQRRQDPQAAVTLITLYEGLIQQFQPDEDPILYAYIQVNLGNAYSELPSGDRATRLEKAIACYKEALRFLTPETRPRQYATI